AARHAGRRRCALGRPPGTGPQGHAGGHHRRGGRLLRHPGGLAVPGRRPRDSHGPGCGGRVGGGAAPGRTAAAGGRGRVHVRRRGMTIIGCHGLVWTGSFDAAGIRHAVAATRQAGFDLIEFPLMDPAAFDVRAARSAIDEHGLEASGSLGLTDATDISSEDPTRVRAGEELLVRAVDVLAELGSRHLCGVVYSAMQKYQQPATPRGLENSRAVIERVAARAAEAGITVSVEVTNRYESNVLNTARQARDFVRGLSPQVGVHLDTYHMNIEET